jgi:hypothetical protein
MFLKGSFFHPLAGVDDAPWQGVLDRHDFWTRRPFTRDAEHVDIAFHILVSGGKIASKKNGVALRSSHEFDAVQVPEKVFADPAIAKLAAQWSKMHEGNCGDGHTLKMGIYVIHAQGTLGYHVDGPVFLKGERADLSHAGIQRGIISLHASRRTVLPLRFNRQDRFMVCQQRLPLARGSLFEFSNVLPHAYFNRGPQDAALLVTTYMVHDMVPQPTPAAPPRRRRSARRG